MLARAASDGGLLVLIGAVSAFCIALILPFNAALCPRWAENYLRDMATLCCHVWYPCFGLVAHARINFPERFCSPRVVVLAPRTVLLRALFHATHYGCLPRLLFVAGSLSHSAPSAVASRCAVARSCRCACRCTSNFLAALGVELPLRLLWMLRASSLRRRWKLLCFRGRTSVCCALPPQF